MSVFSIVDVYYEDEREVPIEEKYVAEPLAAVLMNFDSKGLEEYEEAVCALTGTRSYSYAPMKLDLDLKNRPTPLAKPFIEEPPVLELKKLPSHLRYVFLGSGNTLPVIIAADLGEQQVKALISVFQRYKREIGWTIADIIGIPLGICTHKIQLEEDCIPSIEH